MNWYKKASDDELNVNRAQLVEHELHRLMNLSNAERERIMTEMLSAIPDDQQASLAKYIDYYRQVSESPDEYQWMYIKCVLQFYYDAFEKLSIDLTDEDAVVYEDRPAVELDPAQLSEALRLTPEEKSQEKDQLLDAYNAGTISLEELRDRINHLASSFPISIIS